MAVLADWLESNRLTEALAASFDRNAKQYRTHLQAKLGQQANTGRMVQKWAALQTVYEVLTNFLEECGQGHLLPVWQGKMVLWPR